MPTVSQVWMQEEGADFASLNNYFFLAIYKGRDSFARMIWSLSVGLSAWCDRIIWQALKEWDSLRLNHLLLWRHKTWSRHSHLSFHRIFLKSMELTWTSTVSRSGRKGEFLICRCISFSAHQFFSPTWLWYFASFQSDRDGMRGWEWNQIEAVIQIDTSVRMKGRWEPFWLCLTSGDKVRPGISPEWLGRTFQSKILPFSCFVKVRNCCA